MLGMITCQFATATRQHPRARRKPRRTHLIGPKFKIIIMIGSSGTSRCPTIASVYGHWSLGATAAVPMRTVLCPAISHVKNPASGLVESVQYSNPIVVNTCPLPWNVMSGSFLRLNTACRTALPEYAWESCCPGCTSPTRLWCC